jgi:hypothetical protein
MQTLKMRSKERRQLEVMARVRDKEQTVANAPRLLHVSVCQSWRLFKRYQSYLAMVTLAFIERCFQHLRGWPSDRA